MFRKSSIAAFYLLRHKQLKLHSCVSTMPTEPNKYNVSDIETAQKADQKGDNSSIFLNLYIYLI